MGVSAAEARVPDSLVVIWTSVSLVSRAPSTGASDALAIRSLEARIDVDAAADVAEIPEDALAAPLGAVVAVAVLREECAGGDTCVGAYGAAVAATSLAVASSAVAAGATPAADTLDIRSERRRKRRED